MPVYFPEEHDIHLGNSPLRQVICQIRFSPILRISSEEPAQFQEIIRREFPEFEFRHEVLIGPLGRTTPPPEAEIQPRTYRFYSRIHHSSVTLAPTFIALSSEDYNDWAHFSDTLGLTFDAFQRVYQIPYALRIGLRYINVLTLENTRSESFDQLLSILKDELVGMFRIPEIKAPYRLNQHIRTQEGEGHFSFRFGLNEDTTDEFLLDFDRYIEGEIEVENLLERCNRYHRQIYNAFRWAIADDKLNVFEPVR